MKTNKLKENKSNPRKINEAKLKKLVKSIQEFPKMMELRPIIVDDSMTVLGGNMRLKAIKQIGMEDIPDEWVRKASELTDDEKRRFIVADNVGFGDWDMELLSDMYENAELLEWGVDLEELVPDSSDFGTEFLLPDGDKTPFQQMTFTLADEQAEEIKKAITDIKQTEEYKYCETMGNENSNGNALYLIIMQWAEQKK